MKNPQTISEIKAKWQSFRNYTGKPITIGTLIKMAKNAGADVAAIMDDKFVICKPEEVAPVVEAPTEAICPLTRFSVRGHMNELEAQALEQIAILGDILFSGQVTVVYAKPNTGKTLIILFLIIEAIKEGRIDPSTLFYLNMDDNSKGLIEKGRLAEEYGFHMLVEGYQGFEVKLFRPLMEEMIKNNTARGKILILDTLPQFVDTMHKKESSDFAQILRRFSLKGGTVIALAHTNKHEDSAGKPVYAGTSDIVNGIDCSYFMKIISCDAGKKVVEYSNFKHRGNVVSSACYSYSSELGITYDELLMSVEKVDEAQLLPLKQAAEVASDSEMITAIEASIRDGINSKMKLAAEAGGRAGVSKKIAIKIIEKYTGDNADIHRWAFKVRERGAKVYVLHERPSGQSTEPVLDLGLVTPY